MGKSSGSNIVYSDYLPTLAVGEEMDSNWLDMVDVDKVQFSGYASLPGMTMTIESKAQPEQDPLITPLKYDDGVFYMFSIICRQRYMRFRWENTTGAEVSNVSMEIKQTFGGSDKLSVFPVGIQPSIFSQASLTQSVIRGKSADNIFREVSVNKTGALNVDDFLFAVARGEVQGTEIKILKGHNEDIDTDTDPEDIISTGGLYQGQPDQDAQADKVLVSSSSILDNLTLEGLRKVRIKGLDENFLEAEEELDLQGIIPVETQNLYTRIYKLEGLNAGNLNSNQGLIRAVHANTPARVFACIPESYNESADAVTTIPANKEAYLRRLNISISRNNGSEGSATVVLQTREPGSVWKNTLYNVVTTASPYSPDLSNAIKLNPKTDVRFRCLNVSDRNTHISVITDYIMVEI